MGSNEFNIILKNQSTKLINQELNDKQLQNFYQYMKLLIEWNKKMNLTAITEENEIISKHFIDSLSIIPYINDNSNVIDIGTGAGFPGIPIKIFNNILNITLLDSLNKRINFLNEVIEVLQLNNIRTIHSRVEDVANNKEYREKYDIATSRAVASLNVLLEYMLPLVKVGGKCICMKGSNVEQEIEESNNALNILGGKIVDIVNLTLPNTDNKRNIIIIEKIKNTPNKYPRKAGIPGKNPIV